MSTSAIYSVPNLAAGSVSKPAAATYAPAKQASSSAPSYSYSDKPAAQAAPAPGTGEVYDKTY